MSDSLSIVVIGASGDLARRKVIPALFALDCQGLLPDDFRVVGFARSSFHQKQFRAVLAEHLECRYQSAQPSSAHVYAFLEKCFYCQGQYGSKDSFLELNKLLLALEKNKPANRLYYLAIPPPVFGAVTEALAAARMVYDTAGAVWSRVVIEKPFGYDRASSDLLVRQTGRVFHEKQIYRIDHYLGKEVIQNLFVLRFANLIFEPIWNNRHIAAVQITWKECAGVDGRGGYFDEAGIVRDVMQNHLLQLMAIAAMEPIERLAGDALRRKKEEFLRAVAPLAADDIVLGQYHAGQRAGAPYPAYRAEPGVKPDSITPTFAAAVFQVRNQRWAGVPFMMRAGKALDAHAAEIRFSFRRPAASAFAPVIGRLPANELVIKIQPDEEIYLTMINKVPGLQLDLEPKKLDLRYATTFEKIIPDAYECLLLEVLEGDQSLFISAPELEASWDIFTPLLQAIEKNRMQPEPYARFSSGPASIAKLAEKYNLRWID